MAFCGFYCAKPFDYVSGLLFDKCGFANHNANILVKFLKAKFCSLNFILYLCGGLDMQTDTKTNRSI